jgi:hypothetical protein
VSPAVRPQAGRKTYKSHRRQLSNFGAWVENSALERTNREFVN